MILCDKTCGKLLVDNVTLFWYDGVLTVALDGVIQEPTRMVQAPCGGFMMNPDVFRSEGFAITLSNKEAEIGDTFTVCGNLLLDSEVFSLKAGILSVEEGALPRTSHTVAVVSSIKEKGSGNTKTEIEIGDTILHTVTIENTGNMSIEHVVNSVFKVDSITKSMVFALTNSEDGVSYTKEGKLILAAGKTAILESTYTVQATDNILSTQVTVGGETANSVALVQTEEVYSMDVSLSGATGSGGKAIVGNVLTYTANVANTGNTQISKNLIPTFTVDGVVKTLTWSLSSGKNGASYNSGTLTLPEESSAILIAKYTVGQTDSTLKNSMVFGTITKEVSTTVTETANWTVTEKVTGMSGTDKAQVGDTLTYTVTVANTGNVSISKEVTNVFTADGVGKTLTLALTNAGTGISYNSTTRVLTLAKGKSAIFTATYKVTATDSSLINAVTVDGKTASVTTAVVDKEDWTVSNVVSGATGADGVAKVGDTLTYTVTVANTGNVDITKSVSQSTFVVDGASKTFNLTLTNGATGITYNTTTKDLTLAKGKTAILKSTYIVAATDNTLLNTAAVGGRNSSVSTNVENTPAYTVTKTVAGMTGADNKAKVGDTLTYTTTVTNTGNTTLTEVVEDVLKVNGVSKDIVLVLTNSGTGISYDSATGLLTLSEGKAATFMESYLVLPTDNNITNSTSIGANNSNEIVTEVDIELSTVASTFDPDYQLLGVRAGDMVDGITIQEDGTVTGTLKTVTGFTGFSSDESYQSGYYFPFRLDVTGATVTLKKNGSIIEGKENLPFDSEIIFYITDINDVFSVDVDGVEVIALNFKYVTLA